MAHCHLGDRPNGRLHLTHRGCVKRRASNSVRVIKGVTDDEAARIVERNFEVILNMVYIRLLLVFYFRSFHIPITNIVSTSTESTNRKKHPKSFEPWKEVW